jgi:hypothetical protein
MNASTNKPGADRGDLRLAPEQMALFAAADPAADPVADAGIGNPHVSAQSVGNGRRIVVNPHLLAARRLARKMRRLPDRSAAETRAGLAICRQLKAYLLDDAEGSTRH